MALCGTSTLGGIVHIYTESLAYVVYIHDIEQLYVRMTEHMISTVSLTEQCIAHIQSAQP